MNAITRAYQIAGSQTELARRLGVDRQVVHNWIKRGKVPAGQVIAVERAVNAEITRYDLRPDLYPRTAA